MASNGLRRVLLLSLVAAIGIFNGNASAARGKPGTSETLQVSATFRDGPADKIFSDGKGTYYDNVDKVKSIIDLGGDFDLGTGTTPRFLIRQLGVIAADSGSGCQVPITNETLRAYFATQNAAQLSKMAVGEVKDVNLIVSLDTTDSENKWYYVFRPSEYPESSPVLATRVSASQWTLESVGNSVAVVESGPRSGTSPMVACGTADAIHFKVTIDLM